MEISRLKIKKVANEYVTSQYGSWSAAKKLLASKWLVLKRKLSILRVFLPCVNILDKVNWTSKGSIFYLFVLIKFRAIIELAQATFNR